MLTYGDLSEVGICTLAAHHTATATLVLPLMTHEVLIDGVKPFRCCKSCAFTFFSLDNVKVVVRDISTGQA